MKLNKLVKGEKGQALMIVVLLMLVSALVIAPMLSHVSTGLRTGREVYEEKMQLFYAADSGVEDGLWQIDSENLDVLFTSPAYDPYEYGEIYEYPDSLDVNGKDVDVDIENIWIPKDITAPSSAQAEQIIDGELVISGSVPGTSTYRIKLTYYYDNDEDPGGADLEVDRIGIWLPPGFDYAGNCSLASDPDTAGYEDPDVEDYCSGKAVIWDFSAVPLANFAGDSDYPMERDITFDFSGPGGANPATALSWVETSGVSGIDYTWDADVKVYKVASTATDASNGKNTTVEAYTARSEMRELGSAMSGDYVAIGNSLLERSRTSIKYRDVLLNDSSATIQSGNPNGHSYIPPTARVDLALLYWSGWLEGIDEDVIFADYCSNWDNWQPGSYWSVHDVWYDPDKYFVGRGRSSSEASRTLTMNIGANPPPYSLDLSEYIGQTVSVSWEQSESGRLERSDTLWFAFSGDGGSSWSDYIEAFHDDNPPSNFSDTIPAQYVTDNFKMKFFMDFNSTSEYVYIDNIKITVIPETIADTDCTFEIDGQRVYFDSYGDPVAGSGELVADRYQVLNNMDYGQPHGYSYSCTKDVTDLVQAYTACGAADYTVGDVGATYDQRDEWAYAGWSLVVVYTSPETRGHQLYLYDDFLYCNHDTNLDFDGDGIPGGIISGFLVPDQILGEENAATITCFAGEGDDWYEGDYYKFNGTKLDDGTSSLNDVWNGRSIGMSAEGVDVDTFYVTWSSGLLEAGDTSAQIDIYTDTDIWNLVYTILSFRSDITSGGTISYLVRG